MCQKVKIDGTRQVRILFGFDEVVSNFPYQHSCSSLSSFLKHFSYRTDLVSFGRWYFCRLLIASWKKNKHGKQGRTLHKKKKRRKGFLLLNWHSVKYFSRVEKRFTVNYNKLILWQESEKTFNVDIKEGLNSFKAQQNLL